MKPVPDVCCQGIREVLKILLALEDYEVQSFASIVEFMSRDLNIRPNLYLYDAMLPNDSGIDLYQTLHQDNQNEEIPVVIMSAHAHIGDLEGICEAKDFISKPFDINFLLSRIEAAIPQ